MALTAQQLADKFKIPVDKINSGDVVNLNKIIDGGGNPEQYIRNAVGNTGLGETYNLPTGATGGDTGGNTGGALTAQQLADRYRIPIDRINSGDVANLNEIIAAGGNVQQYIRNAVGNTGLGNTYKLPKEYTDEETGATGWAGLTDAQRQQLEAEAKRLGITLDDARRTQLAAGASDGSAVQLLTQWSQGGDTGGDQTQDGALTAEQIAAKYNIPIDRINSGDVHNINKLISSGGDIPWYIRNSVGNTGISDWKPTETPDVAEVKDPNAQPQWFTDWVESQKPTEEEGSGGMRGMFDDVFGDQSDQMYRMWMIQRMFPGGGGGGMGGMNPYNIGMGQSQPYGQNSGYGQNYQQQNQGAQSNPYQGHYGQIRY